MDRRELLGLGASIDRRRNREAAAATRAAASTPYSRCYEPLDEYVTQYMSAMNIPA